MQAKSLNKVFGSDFIPLIPYMRCSTIAKHNNIKYPAMVQLKADGAFVNVIVENGKVVFFNKKW